jgi:hypothetical protein
MCVAFVPIDRSKYPNSKRMMVRSNEDSVFAGISGSIKGTNAACVLLTFDDVPKGQNNEQWFLPCQLTNC